MNINHYSYKGIGETVLTFKTYKNLNKGDFIRLDSEGTAVLADANSEFVGVVLAVLLFVYFYLKILHRSASNRQHVPDTSV